MKKKKKDRKTSIVMLTHNNVDFTRGCLEKLERTTEGYELVIVDNASTDGTVSYLRGFEKDRKNVRIQYNKTNRGFAAGCNQGVGLARYGLICLLNNDTLPFPGWLEKLRDAMKKGVGAVGAKLIFPDNTLQHCGIDYEYREQPVAHVWPLHRHYGFPEEILEANALESVPAVTGACLLTTKLIWDQVDGMDEGYMIANFEDVDFNLKLREAGFDIVYQPGAKLIHYSGTTIMSKQQDNDSPGFYFQANFERLMQKWFDKMTRGFGPPQGPQGPQGFPQPPQTAPGTAGPPRLERRGPKAFKYKKGVD